jgi:glycosyltransferase involved in cell wall biosynthesis
VKVVYVSTLERGGPLSHVRMLAPEVARLGADVLVVCATDDVAESFRKLGVDAVVAPLGHKLDLRGATHVWPLLEGADVVHTHDRRGGLLVRPQARVRGARPVHTLHGLPEEIAPRLGRNGAPVPPGVSRARLAWLLHGYPRVEATLSALGDVVTPSAAMAGFLTGHGVAKRRVHVIPYGVPRGSPVRGSTDRPFTVGTAANLEYWKGIDVLVQACAGAQAPLRLEIYGDGALRGELERQAQAAHVDARFHGFVDDFPARLPSLDVFALPSRADNFPVAILEAMAHGLPVIAARVGGVPELVADGETGILVEPDDIPALTRALDRLGADPELRASFGARGAERVAERFSADGTARQMLTLYERLCGSST